MTAKSIPIPINALVLPDGATNNVGARITRAKGSGTAPVQAFLYAAFDAAARWDVYAVIQVPQDFASAPVLRLHWRAAAITGNTIWGGRIAAITPGDAVTMESKSFATATTATAAPAGTTLQQVETVITLANIDSMAPGDDLLIGIYRDAAAGGDTMAGDAQLVTIGFEYS